MAAEDCDDDEKASGGAVRRRARRSARKLFEEDVEKVNDVVSTAAFNAWTDASVYDCVYQFTKDAERAHGLVRLWRDVLHRSSQLPAPATLWVDDDASPAVQPFEVIGESVAVVVGADQSARVALPGERVSLIGFGIGSDFRAFTAGEVQRGWHAAVRRAARQVRQRAFLDWLGDAQACDLTADRLPQSLAARGVDFETLTADEADMLRAKLERANAGKPGGGRRRRAEDAAVARAAPNDAWRAVIDALAAVKSMPADKWRRLREGLAPLSIETGLPKPFNPRALFDALLQGGELSGLVEAYREDEGQHRRATDKAFLDRLAQWDASASTKEPNEGSKKAKDGPEARLAEARAAAEAARDRRSKEPVSSRGLIAPALAADLQEVKEARDLSHYCGLLGEPTTICLAPAATSDATPPAAVALTVAVACQLGLTVDTKSLSASLELAFEAPAAEADPTDDDDAPAPAPPASCINHALAWWAVTLAERGQSIPLTEILAAYARAEPACPTTPAAVAAAARAAFGDRARALDADAHPQTAKPKTKPKSKAEQPTVTSPAPTRWAVRKADGQSATPIVAKPKPVERKEAATCSKEVQRPHQKPKKETGIAKEEADGEEWATAAVADGLRAFADPSRGDAVAAWSAAMERAAPVDLTRLAVRALSEAQRRRRRIPDAALRASRAAPMTPRAAAYVLSSIARLDATLAVLAASCMDAFAGRAAPTGASASREEGVDDECDEDEPLEPDADADTAGLRKPSPLDWL
jgi:CheY-like chemotaxis protein